MTQSRAVSGKSSGPEPSARAQPTTVKVAQAKGRPMLSWVGKRPLREVRTYPAQLVERFAVDGQTSESVDWSDWPARFDHGGLLVHGEHRPASARVELERPADGRAKVVIRDTYEFALPDDSTAVAVRITDMLGEEVLVVLPLSH